MSCSPQTSRNLLYFHQSAMDCN